VAAALDLADLPLFAPRFNVAPTQAVLAVRRSQGIRQASLLHWGLIPSWADDAAIGNRMINARAETVADKPAFRAAFKRSRCLIVADGFYEWQKTGRAKQPFYIQLADDRPFAFAGLAEHWHRGDLTIDSCTIITTTANELMAPIHDRMPVILRPDDYDHWLGGEQAAGGAKEQQHEKEMVLSLLRPFPAELMRAYPVSTLVNSPRNENPACIEAVS